MSSAGRTPPIQARKSRHAREGIHIERCAQAGFVLPVGMGETLMAQKLLRAGEDRAVQGGDVGVVHAQQRHRRAAFLRPPDREGEQRLAPDPVLDQREVRAGARVQGAGRADALREAAQAVGGLGEGKQL